MSTGQKALVAVLVVVAALFVATVATQGGADEDRDAAHAGLVGLLSDRLGRAASVERSQVSAPCLGPDDVLTVQSGCALTVGPSEGQLRQVRLDNDGPLPVRITAPIPDRDGTADHYLDVGASVSVAVDRDGGTIEIGCAGLTPCRLRLVGAR